VDRSEDGGRATPRPFPRVPGYAWAWFQRSRPVLTEAAQRLTGTPPGPGFADELREAFDDDAFTRDVVIDVVAEVAFSGRAPTRRPAGVSWDRGLTWWAAALAGTTLEDFEARSTGPEPTQRPLFDVPRADATAGRRSGRRGPTQERLALARALRELLTSAEGGQVPASVIRQLIAQLEES
jgi:hypothetical protein